MDESFVKIMEVRQLCVSPSIWFCQGLLNSAECNHVIAMGKVKMARNEQTGLQESDLQQGQDFTIAKIEGRIAEVVKRPAQNAQPLIVRYYSTNEQHINHYDYVLSSNILKVSGQRTLTVVVFLNDPQDGGDLYFPSPQLKINAQKGDMVLYFNTLDNGQIDTSSLHGYSPVVSGERWVALQYFYENTYQPPA